MHSSPWKSQYEPKFNSQGPNLSNQIHYLRPIGDHLAYDRIYDKLTQLTKNIQNVSLIKDLLFQFSYFTKEQEQIERSVLTIQKNFKPGNPLKELLEYLWKLIKGQNKGKHQNYRMLQYLEHKRVCSIFAKIAEYVLLCQKNNHIKGKYYKVYSHINLVCSGQSAQTQWYSKSQVLYVLSLMVLNLVPKQIRIEGSIFNRNFTFGHIFSNCQKKTKVILDYFESFSGIGPLIQEMKAQINKIDNPKSSNPQRNLSSNQLPLDFSNKSEHFENKDWFLIKRNVRSEESVLKDLFSGKRMGEYSFLPDTDTMEDYILADEKEFSKKFQPNLSEFSCKEGNMQKVQVSFANQYIGGGALTHGMVQEEIIYLTHPELFVTMVLCSSLKFNEALYYEGFRRYFKNYGYGRTLDRFEKETEKIRNLPSQIVSIDAKDFQYDEYSQYEQQMINREILKATVGFGSVDERSEIVTGNWGCGIFKGDHQLKFMIQWIASSLAGRRIVHCPYKQTKRIFRNVSKDEFLPMIRGKNVYDVYQILKQAIKQKRYYSGNDLIESVFLLVQQAENKRDFVQLEQKRREENYVGEVAMQVEDSKWQDASQIMDQISQPNFTQVQLENNTSPIEAFDSDMDQRQFTSETPQITPEAANSFNGQFIAVDKPLQDIQQDPPCQKNVQQNEVTNQMQAEQAQSTDSDKEMKDFPSKKVKQNEIITCPTNAQNSWHSSSNGFYGVH